MRYEVELLATWPDGNTIRATSFQDCVSPEEAEMLALEEDWLGPFGDAKLEARAVMPVA